MNSNKILALYPNVEDHINIREAFDGSNNEIVCVTCVVDAVKLLMKQDYSLVFVDSRIATVDNATITTLKTITCAPIAIVSALIHQKVNEKNASDNIHTHHEHTHIPTFNENHAARIHYHHVLNFSGELIIDPNRREVLLAGEELKLTKILFPVAIIINLVYPNWKNIDDEFLRKGSKYSQDPGDYENLLLTSDDKEDKKELQILMGIFTITRLLSGSCTALSIFERNSDEKLNWFQLNFKLFPECWGFVHETLLFSFSFVYGFDKAPMNYLKNPSIQAVYYLWIIKYFATLAVTIVSFHTYKNEIISPNANKIISLLPGFLNVSSIVSIVVALVEAGNVEFERLPDEYVDKKHLKEAFEKDKEIFISDNIGYIFDDVYSLFCVASSAISIFSNYLSPQIDVYIIIGLLTGLAVFDLGSVSCHFASSALYSQFPTD